jgi:hypothetical protein
MSSPHAPKTVLHLNPTRVEYTVSEAELRHLATGTSSVWKDVCLVTGSLGIPSVINAIQMMRSQQTFTWSIALFLNSLVGVVCVLLAVAFGIAWRKSATRQASIVDEILKRPAFDLHVSGAEAQESLIAVPQGDKETAV